MLQFASTHGDRLLQYVYKLPSASLTLALINGHSASYVDNRSLSFDLSHQCGDPV